MHLVNTSLRAILLHQSDWFHTHRICIIRKSLLCQSGLLRCDVHVCGLEYEELVCLCLMHGSCRKHDLLEGSVLEFLSYMIQVKYLLVVTPTVLTQCQLHEPCIN